MAIYPAENLKIFMAKVTAANSHFERKKTSSLRVLIDLLLDPKGAAHTVGAVLRQISVAKQKKYWQALLYLRQTYPALPIIALQGGSNLGKLNAAKFEKNLVLPASWNEDFSGGPGANKLMKKVGYGEDAPYQFQREIAANSNAFINKTLEQYIYENSATVGGVLIHMGSHVDSLDYLVGGVSHCNHLISVIEALAVANAPLCILLQNTDTVCGSLRAAVAKCTTTVVREGTGHMGGKNDAFQLFVQSKTTMIMMGYDGDVCVGANSFGTGELTAAGKLVVPVIHQANIVTSRAVLVTNGVLNKVDKWGVLLGT